MAGQRLFVEGVDRDPPEVVAAGAGELGEVLGWVGRGTAMSELENWSQARPPTAIAAPIASTAERDRRDPLQHARVAGELERPAGQPPAAPLQPPQAGEERRAPGAVPASRISSTVTPWSTAACVGDVVGEAVAGLDREHRRQRADRADRQRRQHPEAVAREGEQAAGGDEQGQQAAARVGEVEGEQRPPAAPPTAIQRSAVQRRGGSSRAAARRRSRTSTPLAFQ